MQNDDLGIDQSPGLDAVVTLGIPGHLPFTHSAIRDVRGDDPGSLHLDRTGIHQGDQRE
jgi:hypothetical protein